MINLQVESLTSHGMRQRLTGEIRHHLLTEQVKNGFPPGGWRQREGVRVTRGQASAPLGLGSHASSY